MRTRDVGNAWVVYRMTLPNGDTGNVVCEQREWEALQAQQPGRHALLHSGLGTKQEAEKLSRGTSGDDYKRRGKKPERPAPPPEA